METDLQVPLSLLLDPDLTPAAKLLWTVLQRSPCGPSRLAAHSLLARITVHRALPLLAKTGWCTLAPRNRATACDRSSGVKSGVSIPSALVADRSVGIRGKLLFGLLQVTPQFRTGSGQCTFAQLSQLAGCSINAGKRALRELEQSGWVRTSQKNRLAPIRFRLQSPVMQRGEAALSQAQRRLDKARFGGEALMREYLTLLVDSTHFRDNHSPNFLLNPWTTEHLQFDRFYPPGVGFEFNGAQHYGETKRYPGKAEAVKQWARDSLKLGLCQKQGVKLIIIHAEDLSLETMRRKVGKLLPLRNLVGYAALIEHLEIRSKMYRDVAENGDQWAQGWI